MTSFENISCSQSKEHSQKGLALCFRESGLSHDRSGAYGHRKCGRALQGSGRCWYTETQSFRKASNSNSRTAATWKNSLPEWQSRLSWWSLGYPRQDLGAILLVPSPRILWEEVRTGSIFSGENSFSPRELLNALKSWEPWRHPEWTRTGAEIVCRRPH